MRKTPSKIVIHKHAGSGPIGARGIVFCMTKNPSYIIAIRPVLFVWPACVNV